MKNTPKLCIIDDDYIYRYTVVKKMETMNMEVSTSAFEDAELALNFIKENIHLGSELPDIIFLDVDMPVMDGFQFVKEFAKIENQLKKKIHIYMISSSLDPLDIKRAQQMNAITDYFVKPIKTEQLQSVFSDI